jgi:hypothetical protein
MDGRGWNETAAGSLIVSSNKRGDRGKLPVLLLLLAENYAAFAVSRKLFTLSCARCTLAACRRTI